MAYLPIYIGKRKRRMNPRVYKDAKMHTPRCQSCSRQMRRMSEYIGWIKDNDNGEPVYLWKCANCSGYLETWYPRTNRPEDARKVKRPVARKKEPVIVEEPAIIEEPAIVEESPREREVVDKWLYDNLKRDHIECYKEAYRIMEELVVLGQLMGYLLERCAKWATVYDITLRML